MQGGAKGEEAKRRVEPPAGGSPAQLATPASTVLGARAASLDATAQLMNRSPRVMALSALGASIQAAPHAPVVQRVKIEGVDITKDSPFETVKNALKWSKNLGLGVRLSLDQIKELLQELEGRDGFELIVETLEDKKQDFEEDEEEEEKLGKEDGKKEQKEEAKDEKEGFQSEEERKRERRDRAEAFRWTNYPQEIHGYRKLGVHETNSENVVSLVRRGPDEARIGSGNKTGKGPGFYVTHVGQKTLYNATEAITYGTDFVAVYVPNGLPGIRSPNEESNHVDVLDREYGRTICYYIMSGGSEIVIPVRSFGLVRLVVQPEDVEAFK
jgi:hypothetical protein